MHEFERVDCEALKTLIADRRFNLRPISQIPIHKIKRIFPDFANMLKDYDLFTITEEMRLSEEYQKIKKLRLRELKDLLGDECK